MIMDQADATSGHTMFGEEVGNLRKRFMCESGCQFVHPAYFCSLIVSSLDLKRSDENTARLAGLLDMTSGIRYLIELEKLGIYRW
jgi:hypothetical protein